MPILFSTERDPNAGLLPEGCYRFVVEKAEERMKPGGEYPYAALSVRPIVKGQKWNSLVFDNISSSPKARFRVDAFMDCVGAPNEPGQAGISWFIGKSGWALFTHGVDQKSKKLRANVSEYFTEEQAEAWLAKQAEEDGSDEDTMTVSTSRSSRPIPNLDDDDEPVVRRKSNTGRTKTRQPVVELEDEELDEVPF